MRTSAVRRGALACALALVAAGCGSQHGHPGAHGDPGTPGSPSPSSSRSAVPSPGELGKPTLSPDILVYSTKPLSSQVVAAVRRVPQVTATERFAMAQFYYHETPVKYAAVDPAAFRRWTLGPTAESTAVWRRVAGGEIAIAPRLAKRVEDRRDFVHIGDSKRSVGVHVGAYAQLFDPRFNDLGVEAVVNATFVHRLRMVPDNALLVSTGSGSPQQALKRLRSIAGRTASVQILGFTFDPKSVQTAVLTGAAVNGAVGTYNYTATAGGRVIPDPAWVHQYIRTEQVPILGAVSCNKVMFPQLIGALAQVQRAGLARYIHTYNGCFVPRYIAGTHQLSYHAFGLAIDIDAATNQRGTRGTMDPRVVSIFREWGFEWGGAWHFTDPMHFQLDRVSNGHPMSNP